MSFSVFTECCSNLPGSCLRDRQIFVLPAAYIIDGSQEIFDGDIESFQSHEYYDRLRAGSKVQTSLLNTQMFLEHFRPELEKGRDIVFVGMSSGVSGTYQAAVLAAQELQEAYPGLTVRTVDSKGAGLGTGLLTLRAADLRDEGLSAVQAADALDGEVQNLCQYFTVDDLMFLRGTGRLSTTGALMGTLLGVKPILWGDETGHIVVHSKCRGRKKSVETLAQIYARKAVSPGTRRVAISHGDCPEDAQALADLIRAAAAPGELIICPHEPFTGSHVGPGMLGLFFFGDGR